MFKPLKKWLKRKNVSDLRAGDLFEFAKKDGSACEMVIHCQVEKVDENSVYFYVINGAWHGEVNVRTGLGLCYVPNGDRGRTYSKYATNVVRHKGNTKLRQSLNFSLFGLKISFEYYIGVGRNGKYVYRHSDSHFDDDVAF